MKRRWYFSTLIIILTLLGAVYQQQITVPNQKIVLQFTDDEVTSEETQNAIAVVKKQLQTLGVDNIQVQEGEEGRLKITYYSDLDVAIVKQKLSKEKELKLDYTSDSQDKEEPVKFPSNKNSITYNLDVFEIQNSNDTDRDINGIFVLELKPESDRLLNPNTFMSVEDIDVTGSLVEVAYRVNTTIAIAIDNTSYKIPEVRAGPAANENS